MARAFSKSQCNALLNSFGEPLEINGQEFTVIFEEVQIFVEETDGVVLDYKYYFSTISDPVISIGSLFVLKGITQIIYSMEDDLSGITNYFYRKKDYDSWN